MDQLICIYVNIYIMQIRMYIYLISIYDCVENDYSSICYQAFACFHESNKTFFFIYPIVFYLERKIFFTAVVFFFSYSSRYLIS